MSRFPPTPISEYTAELQPYAREWDETAKKSFGANGETFVYRESNDALIGPFPIMIESKDTGAAVQGLLRSMSQYQALPADAREVAILVTGARFQAAFETYAHSRVAVKKTDLTQDQVDLIASGKKPNDLNEACDAAFDTAYHLAFQPGPLPQQLWDRSVRTIGKEGTLGIIHYISLYAYVSILLNAADAKVPSE